MENKRLTGSVHEKLAAKYLESLGYDILYLNYFCRAGEIDIVASSGNYIVFCEVKYRTNTRYGFPEEAVTPRKQKTIRTCANFFITEHHIKNTTPIRFDVIAILGNQINHIKDAF